MGVQRILVRWEFCEDSRIQCHSQDCLRHPMLHLVLASPVIFLKSKLNGTYDFVGAIKTVKSQILGQDVKTDPIFFICSVERNPYSLMLQIVL